MPRFLLDWSGGHCALFEFSCRGLAGPPFDLSIVLAMYGRGKSEKAVIPEKPSNEGPLLTAVLEETVEGRAFAKLRELGESMKALRHKNCFDSRPVTI